MEEDHTESFKDGSDLCQQLMDRYANSAAPQHRHLLATAAALRSNIATESLPLTPPAYFAAAISTLDAAEALDPVALSALVSFMAIALPLVPPGGIAASKSHKASEILVAVLAREGEELGAACMRAMVKCLGVLIGFCDLEDWDGIKFGFEALLKFSICKRPKVRRCAQEAVEKVFKSIKASTVTNEASKLVLSELKSCSALALKLSASRTFDGCKEDKVLNHLEVLHLMNLINLIAPYLSTKMILKVLSEVHKLFSFMSSELARHALKTIEAIFEAFRIKNIVLEKEDIVVSLTSFVYLRDKNSLDTVILASKLLGVAMDLLYNGKSSLWIKNLPPVCRSVIGLLNFEGNTASQASNILKDVLKHHISHLSVLMGTDQTFIDGSLERVKADAIKSTCAVFEDALSSTDGIPNEHVLSVISVLFLELGEFSFMLMRNIVLKLADLMVQISGGKVHNEHLQKCIGCAVYAMGIEKFLSLVPISLDEHSYTYSNIWLLPILKRYVSGASLAYYMDHIMPLAKSFKKASRKVRKSEISQEMMACAHDLRGLLPAFCRHATDTYQNCTRLSDVLITFLKKDPSMHQNVSKALQILVNENKAALSPKKSMEDCLGEYDFLSEFSMQPTYSKKAATKNIKSLASCSNQLLYVLSDLFISSLPEARLSLKGAIGCLASVTDSSVIKELLLSLLKRSQLVGCEGEAKVLSSPGEVDSDQSDLKGCSQRCLILEMVSCLVEGAKDDLLEKIYNLTIHSFQESDESVHLEAYNTLRKILEENPCFSSSRYVELIDLLHGLKPPTAITSLRSRYSCFRLLMVHAMKANLEEEENSKVFLILNEIILTLKDGKDETRKEAYDLLLNLSSTLRDSLCVGSIEPCHKLVSMIMGYLSGSSPHIKSGAVSALSVLVYQDTSLLISVSGLVPSLLSLLQTKDVEIIKAVLGFVKVMVSSLQARELQNILSDVITEILPWSSVSRHHFRSKVTVIFEILLRKCGSAAVKVVTPEKYKFFLKTVLENRHGKSSEAVTKDSENIPQGSFTKRPECRKPGRAATPDKDSIKSNKRKRDNKFETVKPGQKEPFKSTSNDGLSLPKRSRPEESRKGKKSGNKSFIGGGGKRNVKMSSTQNFKAPSKSHKLKRKFQRN